MEQIKQKFENLYEAEADAVYRFCLYKTSRKDVAEDLVQESFVRLWNSLSEGKTIDNLKAFLYQITRNLITDFYRKKKALSLDSMAEQGYEPSTEDHEHIENQVEASMMREVINKLDEKYRDVVYMKLVEEMDLEEISQTLKITKNNATVRLHRGLKYLKEILQNEI